VSNLVIWFLRFILFMSYSSEHTVVRIQTDNILFAACDIAEKEKERKSG